MTKVCSKCKEEKGLNNFYKQKDQILGVRPECKNCRIQHQKSYYIKNKDKIKVYKHGYFIKNKTTLKLKQKEYNITNKEEINITKNLRDKYRRQTDILYKLKRNIGTRIRLSLKVTVWNKNNTTKEILGCTFEQLKQHLEAQFKPGMTWENHGQWHIDHIQPLASAKTEEEIYKLCHYTNLQPLWAAENLSKGAKILPNDQNPQT